MSVENSKLVPNDWTVRGDVDLQGQADWYEAMFDACSKRDWVGGWALWSWTEKLYPLNNAAKRGDYEIYGKTAEEVICKHYKELSE